MNLIEATRRWPDAETAMQHLESVRWKGRPICPYCASDRTCVHASKDKKMPRWQCESCSRAFSATVGTIFHHTHLPLSKWFLAIAIMLNSRDSVSKAQLSRDLSLPYKTAWSLAQRIREAMLSDASQRLLFEGIVGREAVTSKTPNSTDGGGGGSDQHQASAPKYRDNNEKSMKPSGKNSHFKGHSTSNSLLCSFGHVNESML